MTGRRAVLFAVLLIGGCGAANTGDDVGDDTGDDAAYEVRMQSAAVCNAMVDCLAVGANQVLGCTGYVAGSVPVDQRQLLAECASCVGSVTCEALRDGICNEECVEIAALIEPPDGTVSTTDDNVPCSKTWARTRASWTNGGGVFVDIHWCNVASYYVESLNNPGDHAACREALETCLDPAGPTGELSVVARGADPWADAWIEGQCTCAYNNFTIELSVPVWFELPLYVSPP